MQTCGLAPSCAVCSALGACPLDYGMAEAPLEKYPAWEPDSMMQDCLTREELLSYGIEVND